MKLSVRLLTCLFFIPVVISVLIVVCFECGWFLPGALYLPDNPRPEFVVTVVMELLTLCVIPVALRLFRFKRIKNALSGSPERLLRYGAARILLLYVPMVANTLLYYLFVAVPFGYLAIILLLAGIFIYPSASRAKRETAQNDTQR